MKAIVQTAYGSPDVFELKEIERPAIKDDEVLVRVLVVLKELEGPARGRVVITV